MGHPDSDSFCEKMAEAYKKGAIESDAEVRTLLIKDLKFDPILWKGYREVQGLENDLVKAQENLVWADHLVILYPTWWGSLPALLKGFIDRIFLPNFAFTSDGKSIPKGKFKGRSARIITTMDAPAIYNFIIRKPGTNMLKRATLNFCGYSPVKTTTFYGLRNKDDSQRELLLEKIQKLGIKIL